jgi:hypothetical protein
MHCMYFNATAEPGNVTGIMTNVTGSVVMVWWDPLPEDQWNGVPLGYWVRIKLHYIDSPTYVHGRDLAYPRTKSHPYTLYVGGPLFF